jgi:hypothetical protein
MAFVGSQGVTAEQLNSTLKQFVASLFAALGGDMRMPISLFSGEAEFTEVFLPAFRRAGAANPDRKDDF